MTKYGIKIILIMMFILFSFNTVFGETPFSTLNKKDIKNKVQKVNEDINLKKKDDSLPLPVFPPSVFHGRADSFSLKKPEVKGKINNKVILIDSKGEIRLVDDGEIVDSCLVQYPDVLCGEAKNKKQKSLLKRMLELEDENKDLKKQIEDIQQSKEKLLNLKENEINKCKEQLQKSLSEIENLKNSLKMLTDAEKKMERCSIDIKQKDQQIKDFIEFMINCKPVINDTIKFALVCDFEDGLYILSEKNVHSTIKDIFIKKNLLINFEVKNDLAIFKVKRDAVKE